jgi:hypothetical protein
MTIKTFTTQTSNQIQELMLKLDHQIKSKKTQIKLSEKLVAITKKLIIPTSPVKIRT